MTCKLKPQFLTDSTGNALMAEINLKATSHPIMLHCNHALTRPKDPALHPVLFQRFSPLYAKKQVHHTHLDHSAFRQRCVQERMRTLYRQQRQKLRKSLVTSAKDTNDGCSSGVSEALASDAADAEPSVAIESLQTKQSQQVSAEAAAVVAQESQGWLTTIMSKLKQSVNSSTDAARAAVDPGIVNPEWSDQFTMQVQARLGAVVLTILLRSCTIESPTPKLDGAADTPSEEMKPIPAFYHAYLHSKMKRIGIIKATDAVYHHIEMAGEYVETMHPRHQPMVARPLPWTSAEQVIVWWSVCGGHI